MKRITIKQVGDYHIQNDGKCITISKIEQPLCIVRDSKEELDDIFDSISDPDMVLKTIQKLIMCQ